MASHTDPSSLFTKHHAWLQSWLVRKMGNSFDAADLAQDVFMRVLTRQHTAAGRTTRLPFHHCKKFNGRPLAQTCT